MEITTVLLIILLVVLITYLGLMIWFLVVVIKDYIKVCEDINGKRR